MNTPNNGFFRTKSAFVAVPQIIARDEKLSLKAKGLYLLIQSYITIPNFKLYKSYLIKNCLEGECSFNSAWNELKAEGYLKIYKVANSDKKGFHYEYELFDEARSDIPAFTVIKKDGTAGTLNESNDDELGDFDNDTPSEVETNNKPDALENKANKNVNSNDVSDTTVEKTDNNTITNSISGGKTNNKNKLENNNGLSYEDCVSRVNKQIDINYWLNTPYEQSLDLNEKYDAINIYDCEEIIPLIVKDIRDIIVSVYIRQCKTIKIGKEKHDSNEVKYIFSKINKFTMKKILATLYDRGFLLEQDPYEDMGDNPANTVSNPHAYLLAVLYNAAISNNLQYHVADF